MKYKTDYLNDNDDDLRGILEHFQRIDQRCQASLDELNQNREMTSSCVVAQFIEQIEDVENKSDNRTVAAMLIKPTYV